MPILTTIFETIKRLLGIQPVTTETEAARLEEQSRRYREIQGYNLTAIFAGKLATLTVTESTVEVLGGNLRADLINEAIQKAWLISRKWTATSFGTGGVLLIPYVTGGKIYIDTVPQSSMLINRVNGDELRAVSILADVTVRGDHKYFRWADYSLGDDGLLVIRQRVTMDGGTEVMLTDVPEWAGIAPEIGITNVEHLLFAYLKCPVDSRQTKSLYGVPVTYGCDDKMAEITECMDDIRREYRLKKPIVGMDQTLFKTENGRRHLPVTGLFMPVTPSGLNTSGKLWDVYDPAIRDSAYYSRLQHLYEELEKQVGTSRGVLTEPSSRGATATEIKAANADTYAIISDMRKVIGLAVKRLAYAIDVLANAYGLSPMGDYEVSFDWDYSLIESSQESFTQLMSAATIDAVGAEEVRQYVMPDETLEEAQARVEEIKRAKADLSDQLMKEALAKDSRTNPDDDGDDE